MAFKGLNIRGQQQAAYAKGFRIRASENLRKQSVPSLPEYHTKYPSYDAAYIAGIGRWGSVDLDARMGWFISEDGSVQPLNKKPNPRYGKRTSPRRVIPSMSLIDAREWAALERTKGKYPRDPSGKDDFYVDESDLVGVHNLVNPELGWGWEGTLRTYKAETLLNYISPKTAAKDIARFVVSEHDPNAVSIYDASYPAFLENKALVEFVDKNLFDAGGKYRDNYVGGLDLTCLVADVWRLSPILQKKYPTNSEPEPTNLLLAEGTVFEGWHDLLRDVEVEVGKLEREKKNQVVRVNSLPEQIDPTVSPRALNPVFMEVPIKKKGFPGARRVELEEGGKILASLNVLAEQDTLIHLGGWKAKKKGEGYGKQLLEHIIDDKPNLVMIATDGFTGMGEANFRKVVESKGFRVTEWVHGATLGLGRAWRQDFIDQVLDSGNRYLWYFAPEWHSKYKNNETKA